MAGMRMKMILNAYIISLHIPFASHNQTFQSELYGPLARFPFWSVCMSNRPVHGVLPSRPSSLAVLVAAICAAGAASAQAQAQAQGQAQGHGASATELREVVVSASGFEQDIKEAPASITVIPREELAKGRFGSLTDALESVEGIDVALRPARPAA